MHSAETLHARASLNATSHPFVRHNGQMPNHAIGKLRDFNGHITSPDGCQWSHLCDTESMSRSNPKAHNVARFFLSFIFHPSAFSLPPQAFLEKCRPIDKAILYQEMQVCVPLRLIIMRQGTLRRDV